MRRTMQTFKIDDIGIARRCRMAQYRGRETEFTLNGSTVNGMIRSVSDDHGEVKSWTVTVQPIERKPITSAKANLRR